MNKRTFLKMLRFLMATPLVSPVLAWALGGKLQKWAGGRVHQRTPARFRTRVLTEGVIPSLHVDYKSSRIKQYFKQVPGVPQVGARTETTVNNPRDFFLGKPLGNLPALRPVGFQANRRLLEVERLSHDCAVGEETLHQLKPPLEVNGRTSALRTTDLRVLALWHVLVWFRLLPCGFSNHDLRE